MTYSYTSGVKVSIYSGNTKPETLLATRDFHPQYLNYYSSNDSFSQVNKVTNSVPTENFVLFDEPIAVDKKFFISYKINYSQSNKFAVYNSGSSLGIANNTAWLKDENSNWIPANQHSQPITTSLAIQPLLQDTTQSLIEEVKKNDNFFFYNKETNQIILSEVTEKGILSIYNVNGQLIAKIPVKQGQKEIFIHPVASGSIGIVHFISDNHFLSGKFIY